MGRHQKSSATPIKDSNTIPKKPHRLLACCVGVPLLLFLGAGLIYISNSRPPRIEIPTPAMPPNNAYDDFLKAGRLAQAMLHKSPYSMPGPSAQNETLANFAAAEKDSGPALTMLRQGLEKPCQAPPDRSLQSINLNFAQSADIRELARTLAGVARYEELTGHPEKAMETRLDGMEMSVMLAHGNNLLSMLISTACEAICVKGAEKYLPSLTPQQLAQAAERMEKIAAKRTPYSEIVLEEGYTRAAHMQEAWRKDRNSGALLPFFISREGLLRQELDYTRKSAEAVRKPYTGRFEVPLPSSPWIPNVDRDWVITGYAQYDYPTTAAVLLQTQIALYRYKAVQGRFPATLKELTPIYLKAVPEDPFGGAANIPLRYQVKENGRSFLLYSLGPDLKDDGGQPQKRPGGDPGDIVAGYLWYRAPITE